VTFLVLALFLGAADAGGCDGMVEARGDQAMGFSHAMTAHHFTLTSTGGRIFAGANSPLDLASRDAIRAHMQHIAAAFGAGNFEMPMFIHGRTPPGVPTMKRLKDHISYSARDTERGAEVVVETSDPDALEAVHQFLRFQIEDHRTGDSPEVSK
jgi:hypothetical protein